MNKTKESRKRPLAYHFYVGTDDGWYNFGSFFTIKELRQKMKIHKDKQYIILESFHNYKRL